MFILIIRMCVPIFKTKLFYTAFKFFYGRINIRCW